MDREKVISWLEGLAEPDWRAFHSDSEVQNIATSALALLKEDCHNCKLECLLQKYDELKEKYDSLLKEQEKKQITLHKKHVITLGRNDEFSMRKLYEAVCETLLDEGELIIARTDDHEKVDFVFYVADGEVKWE